MVVKTKKWSSWRPMTSKRLRVKVERIKLEGFEYGGSGGGDKVMGVKVRWKGERKHGLAAVGFHRHRHEEFSCKERVVRKGEVIVWEEEDHLENTCCFSLGGGDEYDQHKFVPWDVSFKLTYGECNKGKIGVIGKVSLNLAEVVSKMEASMVDKKLPINVEVGGMTTQATLSVLLSFVEIRDSNQLVQNSTQSEGTVGDKHAIKGKKKQLSLEEVSLSDSDMSVTFDSDIAFESSKGMSEPLGVVQPEPVKKAGFFDWKRRRLTFRPAKMKGEDSQIAGPSSSGDSAASDSIQKTSIAAPYEPPKEGFDIPATWEAREFTSRDGETRLKTQTFFASFDQCSDKAAGPSACTALVTVIAHWLQSQEPATIMPTREEFDSLIVKGSSEWRKLCENGTHVKEFPNKHFDLETVLQAGIHPLTVSREKSYVGFFGPEKFECLKGAMSFDDIWDHEISQSQGIYIVSWNDHFFVLKASEDGYYVIDTLGERLYEGCSQAYILKFDQDSCLMQGKTEETSTRNENEEVICRGKECCKEFIKKFLAAIPLRELESEEKKQAVPYYSLHHRLQIEFNFCSSL